MANREKIEELLSIAQTSKLSQELQVLALSSMKEQINCAKFSSVLDTIAERSRIASIEMSIDTFSGLFTDEEVDALIAIQRNPLFTRLREASLDLAKRAFAIGQQIGQEEIQKFFSNQ